MGRRKCLDDRRQHNSHFCLCHDGSDSRAAETQGNLTAYQTDFTVNEAVDVPTSTRRFPRNHKQKSAEAALAQAGEQFMWFGQHDPVPSETRQVLEAANCSAPYKPWDAPTFKKPDFREEEMNFLDGPAAKYRTAPSDSIFSCFLLFWEYLDSCLEGNLTMFYSTTTLVNLLTIYNYCMLW